MALVKATCKHCEKEIKRPTFGELGERMNRHMERRHGAELGAELVKAQLFVGVMLTRHFVGDPDLETEKSTALARAQLIEMLQGTRDKFDDSALRGSSGPETNGPVLVVPSAIEPEVAVALSYEAQSAAPEPAEQSAQFDGDKKTLASES